MLPLTSASEAPGAGSVVMTVGGDCEAALMLQLLTTPKIGSPNTALVHAVPPDTVLENYESCGALRTSIVPVKAQNAPSGAENVQSGGGIVLLIAHSFTVPKIGSPNTALVHAVPLDNVLRKYEPFAP